MREILFKGKRKDNGEWVEGFLSPIWGSLHIGNEFKAYPINYETVGQFTGLKDKNGKKIFECDIIKYCGVFGVVVYDNTFTAFLSKENEKFYTSFENIPTFGVNGVEVVGNIYDNKELIDED